MASDELKDENIMIIRPEEKKDIDGIKKVLAAAFADDPHGDHSEHILVEKLREQGAFVISLVVEKEGKIVGHIAFSEVTINGVYRNWFGLAPVSVAPEFQNLGIGTMLIKSGLDEIKKSI